jgi:hypothetical protein
MADPLAQLTRPGVSTWLDHLNRARPQWAATGVKDPAYDDTVMAALVDVGVDVTETLLHDGLATVQASWTDRPGEDVGTQARRRAARRRGRGRSA